MQRRTNSPFGTTGKAPAQHGPEDEAALAADMLQPEDLTELEQTALRWIRDAQSTLVSAISDKSSLDIFGNPVPGLSTFKKLERKGLCFQTEEDEDEEGFAFTESIEFTDAGRAIAKKL